MNLISLFEIQTPLERKSKAVWGNVVIETLYDFYRTRI